MGAWYVGVGGCCAALSLPLLLRATVCGHGKRGIHKKKCVFLLCCAHCADVRVLYIYAMHARCSGALRTRDKMAAHAHEHARFTTQNHRTKKRVHMYI